MVPRDRAFTRGTIRKAKRKAKRVLKLWQWFEDEAITPKRIGKASSVHSKGCSCVMCGNPRKWFKDRTIQEKRHGL